jgi:carbonic anhydrase
MCAICGNLSLRHGRDFSRRGFLRLVGGATVGAALSGRMLFAAGEIPKPQNVLSPDAAFERLKTGNARYVDGAMAQQDFGAERHALAGGQNRYEGSLCGAGGGEFRGGGWDREF